MKTLFLLIGASLITIVSFGQTRRIIYPRRTQIPVYQPNARQMAQQQQYSNPYAADVAYYQAFNQRMQPVYNAAQNVERAANYAMSAGAARAGQTGYVIRMVYAGGQWVAYKFPVNVTGR